MSASVIVVSPDELAKLIDSAVRRALDGSAGLRSEPEFRPAKEAPVSRPVLDKLRKAGTVRSFRAGRVAYYHVGDLRSWMEARAKLPKPPPEPAEVIEAADAFERASARARARAERRSA